jgi:predicted phosphatase
MFRLVPIGFEWADRGDMKYSKGIMMSVALEVKNTLKKLRNSGSIGTIKK